MSPFSAGRPIKYRPFEHKGKTPPKAPGVYRIRTDSGKVAYVGETADLRKRMTEHMRITGNLRPGESFEYKVAKSGSDSVSRRQVERQKIAKYKPERNRSCGGEGRKASR